MKAQRLTPAITAASAAVLLVAGCASQTAPRGPNDPVIIRDPNHMVGRSHWEVLDLPGDPELVAAVVGANPNDLLSLGCGRNDKVVSGGFATKTAATVRAKAPRLTVAYDDGTPFDPKWIDTGTSDGLRGFSIFSGDPGYQSTIDDLRRHRAAEVVLSESGNEILRSSFTLDGAQAAIDYVLAACEKKE